MRVMADHYVSILHLEHGRGMLPEGVSSEKMEPSSVLHLE